MLTHKTKLELTDNFMEIMLKMSEGNPGAATVLMNIMNNPHVFAPADPIMVILQLDSLGIYGSHIWILYKDVCKEDITLLNIVLKHVSYGEISREKLREHINTSKKFNNLYTPEELNRRYSK